MISAHTMISKTKITLGFLVICLLALVRSTVVFAIPPTHLSLHHFSSVNKTPGESVQCIYEDKYGIIWLGVESIGLVKYDGKNYTIFKNDPDAFTSISSNYPSKIVEDKNGAIWIGTSGGLNKLNRYTRSFKRYQHDSHNNTGLSANIINDIIFDGQGRMWVASSNGISIYFPDEDRFIWFLHNDDPANPSSNNEVGALHLDAQENIWIATSLHGMFRVKPETYNSSSDKWICSINDYLSGKKNTEIDNWQLHLRNGNINAIRGITSNRNSDTLWIASHVGLYYFPVAQGKFQRFWFGQNELRHLNFCSYVSLLIDKENQLWVGSSNDGLVRISLDGSFTINYLNSKFYDTNQLKSNNIRDLMESRSGLVWICTKFGGLHYYDKRQNTFARMGVEEGNSMGLSDRYVLSVMEDSNGKIWIGTKGGGLNCFNRADGSITVYGMDREPGALRSQRIECIEEDREGLLWFGTANGVWSTDADKPGEFTRHVNLHARNFYIEDSTWLWIGTTNGLFRFSLSEKKLSPLPTRYKNFFDAESNIGITRVFKDKNKVLWIGTNSNGLFEYHSDTDSLINHVADSLDPYSISGNLVREIHEDQKGRLWIGTKSDGLNLYDRETKRFIHKSSPAKLPSNTVYNILEDKNGNFWMGTHSGISMYKPDTEQFLNFGRHHGLQGMIFEINAHAATKDGYFFMGGAMGLNYFNPDEISYYSHKAPLVISKFEVLNEVKAIDVTQFTRFELERSKNYISFEFALLDYTNPEENHYSYQLEPFDEEWVNSGTRNFASYTNLPPGTYRFKVKGTNSDEVWSDKVLEVEIFIPAPIWEKLWFLALLLLVVISIIVTAWYLKIAASKRRENILRKEVAERTKDLYEAYSKLEESNIQIEKHNKALRLQRDRISRQNLELKIHRQNLELMVADRTKDLEEAKLRAEESDHLKSAFLANMSHEIRTPLNAIMGFIDILEADEHSPEEREKISYIIQTNSDSLLQLINDIIDISIIEANQLVIRKSIVNFHNFLEEIALHYRTNKDIKKKSLEIIKSIPDENEELLIFTDQGRVRQIYNNLINNAIKFTDKGYVKFGYHFSADKTHIICFVEDTGIGISEENMQKLFQRFHKIEPVSTKVHRGTGLGLSISKNLAELLGGEIWLSSKVGKGTTFFFTLPLDKSSK